MVNLRQPTERSASRSDRKTGYKLLREARGGRKDVRMCRQNTSRKYIGTIHGPLNAENSAREGKEQKRVAGRRSDGPTKRILGEGRGGACNRPQNKKTSPNICQVRTFRPITLWERCKGKIQDYTRKKKKKFNNATESHRLSKRSRKNRGEFRNSFFKKRKFPVQKKTRGLLKEFSKHGPGGSRDR